MQQFKKRCQMRSAREYGQVQQLETSLLPSLLRRRAEGLFCAGVPLLLRNAADGKTEGILGSGENGSVQVQLQSDVQLAGKKLTWIPEGTSLRRHIGKSEWVGFVPKDNNG